MHCRDPYPRGSASEWWAAHGAAILRAAAIFGRLVALSATAVASAARPPLFAFDQPASRRCVHSATGAQALWCARHETLRVSAEAVRVSALCSSRSSRVRRRKSHRAVAAAQASVTTSCAARAPSGRVRFWSRLHVLSSAPRMRVRGGICAHAEAVRVMSASVPVLACVRARVHTRTRVCVCAMAAAAVQAACSHMARTKNDVAPAQFRRVQHSFASENTAHPRPATCARATRTQAMYGMHRTPCAMQHTQPESEHRERLSQRRC